MPGKWEEWKAALKKTLNDREKCWTKYFDQVESKTGVDRVNISLVVMVIIGIYLIGGHCREFVCNLIGFLYPAYASIKAIESKDKGDDTKWLTYWVVYASFSLAEFFFDLLFSWIPFYWLIKCVFLVFCMLPFRWNGSVMIYKRIIRPLFLKHHKDIDQALDEATAAGEEIVDEGTRFARRHKLFNRRDDGDDDDKGETHPK